MNNPLISLNRDYLFNCNFNPVIRFVLFEQINSTYLADEFVIPVINHYQLVALEQRDEYVDALIR